MAKLLDSCALFALLLCLAAARTIAHCCEQEG